MGRDDANWDEILASAPPPHIHGSQRPTWSGWRGAYRVVTDGDRIVAESEGLGPDHGRSHGDLERDFALKYPDAETRLFGWLIPKSDGSGYGLMLYHWESEQECERARAAAEAWIGKHVHLVDDIAESTDPTLYAIYPAGGEAVDFRNER